MKMNPAALGAVLLLFSGTVNANAGLITYADFSLWGAAVPGYTSLAISDPTGSEGYDDFGSGTASVSYGGVVFATNAALGNGSFYNIGPTFSGSNGFFPVLSSQQQSVGVANILITLAAPVKAFALNFDTFFGSDVTFTLSNGETLTLPSAGHAYDLKSFFGVTDDTPFKTILLTSSDPVLNLNALNFDAAVSPIPEPATWVMLLLGFAGISLFGARLPTRRASAQLIDRARS
ncbi:PEP-CTERM sorting domain-containing protein [Bradyrhizobium sp. AZCC 1693]|uniref:PEP-CTERM sorting domain-containing protein n=1 Tax=Bradyrhizobium sp. AZCC 1693 TaxID=3117029 RepID=UPI002FEFD6C2